LLSAPPHPIQLENHLNIDTLKQAKSEALRFVKQVNALEQTKPQYMFCGTKETGAVKRASMDLSRALAEMRKPG